MPLDAAGSADAPRNLRATHVCATSCQSRGLPHPWQCGLVQADVQIYNKVLALIEDWAEAIDVPAYRAAHEQLKVRSVLAGPARKRGWSCRRALRDRPPHARLPGLPQVQSVRFPNRTVRDLSEYKEGASTSPYGQTQVRRISVTRHTLQPPCSATSRPGVRPPVFPSHSVRLLRPRWS